MVHSGKIVWLQYQANLFLQVDWAAGPELENVGWVKARNGWIG
jgi:hypothetical protein